MSSARLLRRSLLPVLVGLAGSAVVILVMIYGGIGLARLMLEASDRLMLHESGLHLGHRAASDAIVLVLFDDASAKQINGLPTPSQDLELYAKLLDHGALSVADTRMIAIGTPEQLEESADFFRQMAELAKRGALLRDIWIANAPEEVLQQVRPCVSHNVLNMHVNPDAFFESRLYPLLAEDSFGVHETMPLQLVRRIRRLATPSLSAIEAEMLRCGITASQEARRTGQAPTVLPYQLEGLKIDWHPSPSKTTLVPPAAFLINYAAPPSDLARVSYIDVLTGAAPAKAFQGKTVLIGYEAAIDPSSDTFQVPTSTSRAGAAEVVGSALQTLIDQRLMTHVPVALTIALALVTCLAVSLTAGMLRPAAAAAGVLVLLLGYLGYAVVAFRADWMADFVVIPAAAASCAVVSGGYRYWTEVRWRTRVVDLFGRYVPRAVVSQLVLKPDAEALAVGGVNREVTVLFADVRGFTSFAEDRPPEAVIERLNELLQVMVDCTFEHEGTVDKFIGDAILVLFNAPLEQPDHVERAVRTAWMIQQQLKDQADDLAIGIGIHRGEAVVGTIGTPQRMEYTAIGNTVNIASRLCDSAGAGEIVVSAAVAKSLRAFELEDREPIQAKGMGRPLATSLVKGLLEGDETQEGTAITGKSQ